MKNSAVREKLMSIQRDAKEPALFPYLQQLFRNKGYSNVMITHGVNEFGKDLVFKERDEKNGIDRWFAVVVKNKNIGIKDFTTGGEIITQIHQAFEIPYTELSDEFNISQVIVVANGTISEQAKIMSDTLPRWMRANIQVWNYQRLGEEIENYAKDEFLGINDVAVTLFIKNQLAALSEFRNSKELYNGLEIKDINEIYVSAKTTYNKYQKTKKAYVNYEQPESGFGKNEELDDAIEMLNSNKHTLVSGIPTSGKSLLLKRIGYHAMSAQKEKPDVAFYFEIGEIDDVASFDIFGEVKKQFFKLADVEFKRSLFSKIIVLLDGLDEITDENKKILIGKVNDIINRDDKADKNKVGEPENFTGSVQFFISSREIELIKKENLLPNFSNVELLPFDVGQAFKLVKKLMPNSKIKAEAFVKAIKDDQLSNTLTRTPMALTLMAILYREDEIDLDELPANITEIYNKFSDYYLNRWDTAKGLSLQYKYEEAKQILGKIAKHLHEKNEQLIDKSSLIEFLYKLKDEYDYEELADVLGFVDALKRRAGIFGYEEELDSFKFSHLSFQEYFVSTAFNDSEENELMENLCSQWWENTIVFYCGRQPSRDVFIKKACDTIVPLDMEQRNQYLFVMAKSLQASHLIPRVSKGAVVKKIVWNFEQFYKEYTASGNILLTAKLTTIDYILNYRGLFKKLFSTKHIAVEDLIDAFLDTVLKKDSEYSDVVSYCAAHLLAERTGDVTYLEKFLEKKDLNVRWNRIIFVDIRVLKMKEQMDDDLYLKIKRKQLKYKDYIQQQFQQSAFKHINPPVKS
ncbi:hypothetical protein FNT36_20205 [Hymenobacter setariae]|uniref:Restriction endonuclease type IV Mrr domain-containing protein n=1 Tax=Hymenobacter setariae TaxID=2594794 RepID=A0A558BPR1_9BACT|nr:restriction endonuclease [Hymenobacter setariae]TVT38509.1 hypothetical protein FNT36_20205 [Hymenobacter setariae]